MRVMEEFRWVSLFRVVQHLGFAARVVSASILELIFSRYVMPHPCGFPSILPFLYGK